MQLIEYLHPPTAPSAANKAVRREQGKLHRLCMAAQVGSASLFLAPLSALEIPTVTR